MPSTIQDSNFGDRCSKIVRETANWKLLTPHKKLFE